jgi:hypothetical protein
MNPLSRLGLAHPEHAPLQQWRGMLLELDQDEYQLIFRGRQGTVLIGGIASRLPAPAMQGPVGHVARKGFPKWASLGRQFVPGQTHQR